MSALLIQRKSDIHTPYDFDRYWPTLSGVRKSHQTSYALKYMTMTGKAHLIQHIVLNRGGFHLMQQNAARLVQLAIERHRFSCLLALVVLGLVPDSKARYGERALTAYELACTVFNTPNSFNYSSRRVAHLLHIITPKARLKREITQNAVAFFASNNAFLFLEIEAKFKKKAEILNGAELNIEKHLQTFILGYAMEPDEELFAINKHYKLREGSPLFDNFFAPAVHPFLTYLDQVFCALPSVVLKDPLRAIPFCSEVQDASSQ